MLARLAGYELPGRRPIPVPADARSDTGLEMVEVPAGECTIGATDEGFAYDNERPRHRTDVRGYLIGRTPITNATYLTFVEGGGYERRDWWSDEGWAWKEEYDISRPSGVDGGPPRRVAARRTRTTRTRSDPSFTCPGSRPTPSPALTAPASPPRSSGRRRRPGIRRRRSARRYPWGNRRPVAGQHANLDHRGCGTAPVGAYPDGASPYGCLGMIGDVWEWTSSAFDGYPGFVAHPYREYSEVFFGGDYRVLRGGSWATRTRVATSTFRNWDHPQRRQIFAGLRIARDA